jgi:enoyl-CoA hydratase
VSDGVGHLNLDRMEVMNALDLPTVESITHVMESVGPDEHVRVVILSGRGRAFCTGADLSRPLPPPDADPDMEVLDAAIDMILAIRRAPLPVIAMVNGPAAGVGCSLALACDLVYASTESYFLLAFARVGLVPDGGASLLIPQTIGRLRATEMALLADRIPAETAVQWGLANAAHPEAELASAVQDVASRLATGPALAYAAVKAALNHTQLQALEEQLRFERDQQARLKRTHDYRNAVAAFAAKRTPEFTGR